MKGSLKCGALENYLFVLCGANEMVVILPPETIAIAIAKQTSSTGPLLIRLRWRLWRDSTSFAPSNSTLRQQACWSLMPGGCVSYMIKLPADLNIKLHVNRRDLSLLDNHGQIWNYLVSIALVVREEFSYMLARHALELQRVEGNNDATCLGLKTFNISTFEWIAGLQIDDYWFAMMRIVLATLEALPLEILDWTIGVVWHPGYKVARRLAGRLQAGHHVVEAIFFTSNSDCCVAGLLDTLDDAMYRAVCRAVWNRMDLHFVDLKWLLCNRRLEMEAAHVISWVDCVSVVELESVNPKLKNKLQLLEHLLITHVNDLIYRKRFEDASWARLL
ncbi:hypothetical protein RB213_004789 [Colletotrichum asianum]